VTLHTRRHAKGAVVMSRDTYNSLLETVHLPRTPANAAHPRRSPQQADGGEVLSHGLIDHDLANGGDWVIDQLTWTAAAWDDYLHWQSQDRQQPHSVNQLMQACLSNHFDGIGKTELPRQTLAGCWSRRIDQEHRLIDWVDGDLLVILACRYHYLCCHDLARQRPMSSACGRSYIVSCYSIATRIGVLIRMNSSSIIWLSLTATCAPAAR
jgi:toxin YoeB